MPARYDRSRRRRQAARCGRPTKKGTPCKLPQEIGRGCRHHATRAEREAAAQEEKARADRAREQAEREQRTVRAVLALVALAVLAGIGIAVWDSWKDDQHESMCRPHRTEARALSDKAREVRIPLVFAGDPHISILQLGARFPDLGSLDATSATELDITTAYSEKRDLAAQAARVVLDHQECFADGSIAEASRIEQAPTEVSRVEMPSAAHCSDGWPSTSTGRRGACSHHGGVVPARPWATLLFD
ncbi:DUF3761 domain-containing protein [Streptomyces sp. NPDC060065]|uniref:DUF3761 domain-containing protein n=1 Tax=Streptomyces sp. NPDC060065 TaxID=3347050 RepID=UPI0036BB4C24